MVDLQLWIANKNDDRINNACEKQIINHEQVSKLLQDTIAEVFHDHRVKLVTISGDILDINEAGMVLDNTAFLFLERLNEKAKKQEDYNNG